ncbi:hypothetical protein PSENEW3_00003469 [Picochlorum sp. SENEW3]|nr:hypothetical protein PSENEW3_00003469 [Picochlorum sp. SENEW3]
MASISRAEEQSLRSWQRRKLRSFWNENHRAQNLAFMRQLFVIFSVDDNLLNMTRQEQAAFRDIRIVQEEPDYERLMLQTMALLSSASSILNSYQGACTACYVIKVDTDVVVSYHRLVEVIRTLPASLVYFGKMLPNQPIEYRERLQYSTSLDLLPLWALGQMYGLSLDVVDALLSRENLVRIYRRGRIYREEDRGVGLWIWRSRIPVKYVNLKGIYGLCSPFNVDCHHYGDSIGFHVGHSLSGAGGKNLALKLELLQNVSLTLSHCNNQSNKNIMASLYNNMHFLHAEYWMYTGCSSLTNEGRFWLDKTHASSMLHSTGDEFNRSCSDFYYLISLLQNSHMQVRSARNHYLTTGHLSPSSHYFCPPDRLRNQFLECDREAIYLENYPDVKKAIQQGGTGHEHYLKYGKAEGRSWSCYSRYQDSSNGTTLDCLGFYQFFIDRAYPTVQKWPLDGNVIPTYENNTCSALVMIDGREHPWLDFSLRVHRHFLGRYWKFYLLGPPAVADIWRQKYEGTAIEIIEIPSIFGNFSDQPREYNELLLSDFLWEKTVQCEFVLITQSDALLLRDGIEDFFDFDYVGSPVYPETFPAIHWRYLSALQSNSGGNGGLSLRKRSAMLWCLENFKVPFKSNASMWDGMAEDSWFSQCLVENNFSLPSPHIANRFSVGSKCRVDAPFGMHKLWMNCNLGSCIQALVGSDLAVDVFGRSRPSKACPGGEEFYRMVYEDVNTEILAGRLQSGWDHFENFGKTEGREWRCLPGM